MRYVGRSPQPGEARSTLLLRGRFQIRVIVA
jgi:hypothetical protein